MKRFLVILLLLIPLLLQGQNKQIVVRKFNNAGVGDMRARTSPVLDQNQRLTALVEIFMPDVDSTVRFDGIVGTPVLSMGSWLVHVAEGTKHISIWVPGCYPFEFSFAEAPESGKVYVLTLDTFETINNHTLILPFFSYNKAQYSYGLMFAHLWKRNGFYFDAKTDFTFGLNITSECSEEGIINGISGWFTGDAQTSRMSVTTGYIRQLFQTRRNVALYIYGGFGYGSRILAWRIDSIEGVYEYSRVRPYSYNGYEFETGIIIRKGSLAFLTGILTNQFKYTEATVGIGFKF